MAALIDASRLKRAPACSDLGFALGPRINAGGRVGESTLGVRLLTTQRSRRGARNCRTAFGPQRRTPRDRGRSSGSCRRTACRAAQSRRASCCGRRLASGRYRYRGWPDQGKDRQACARHRARRAKPAKDRDARLPAWIWVQRSSRARGRPAVAGGGHAMAAGLTVDSDKIDAFADWLDERLGRQSRAPRRAAKWRSIFRSRRRADARPGRTLEEAGPYGIGWPGPRVAVGPVRLIKATLSAPIMSG